MGKFCRAQLKGRSTVYTNRFKKNLVSTNRLQDVKPGAVTCGFRRHPLTGKPLAVILNPDNKEYILPALKGQKIGDIYGVGNLEMFSLDRVPQGTTVCAIYSNRTKHEAITSRGCKGTVISKSNKKVKVKIGRRVTEVMDSLCLRGVIGGGEAKEKPRLRAGVSFKIYKARRKKYPRVSSHKMNVYQSPIGGSYRKKRGVAMTVSSRASPGAKCGHIGASRSGRRKK